MLLKLDVKDSLAKSLIFGSSGIVSTLTQSVYDKKTNAIEIAKESANVFIVVTLKHALKYAVIDYLKSMLVQQSLMPFCAAGAVAYLAQELYSGKASLGSSIYKAAQGCFNIAAYEVYEFSGTQFYFIAAVFEGADAVISHDMPNILGALSDFTSATHTDEF